MTRRCLLTLMAATPSFGVARQPWTKKGRILAPGFAETRSTNLLSAPCLVKLKDGRLRLYFWARHGEGHPSTPEGRRLKNYIYAAEASPDRPTDWTLLTKDPMLGPSPTGNLNDAGPAYPFVIPREDGPWLMYYCTWGSWAPEGQISNRSAVALSHDQGITWSIAREPILDLGKPGEWDAGLTGSVCVIRSGASSYRMWYTAGEYGPYDDGTRNLIAQIGHATSRDGIHWTKTKSNPVMAARQKAIPRFEAVVSKPFVLQLGGQYHLWYSRRVNDGRGYQLAYARSADGLRWERVHDDNVMPLTPGTFDSENTSYPNVIEMGDELWMYYVGNRFGSTGIGWATLKKSELG